MKTAAVSAFFLILSCSRRARLAALALLLVPVTAVGQLQCEAESQYLEQVENRRGVERLRDYGCFIRLDDVKPDSRIIVDIRDQQSYEALSIPGSLSMPSGDFLRAPHWRDRPLLLVGYGIERSRLAELCATASLGELRDVQILLGGIDAWRAARRPLSAEGLALDQTALAAPRSFLTEAIHGQLNLLMTAEDQHRLGYATTENLRAKVVTEPITAEHVRRILPNWLQTDSLIPYVILSSDPQVVALASTYRNLYVVDPEALVAFQSRKQQMLAQQYRVPARHRCGG